MMKKQLILWANLFLCACATPQQIEERRAMQEQMDIETCKSYGLRPGSEAFGNCRLQIDLARQQPRYYDDYYYGPRVGTGFYYLRR